MKRTSYIGNTNAYNRKCTRVIAKRLFTRKYFSALLTSNASKPQPWKLPRNVTCRMKKKIFAEKTLVIGVFVIVQHQSQKFQVAREVTPDSPLGYVGDREVFPVPAIVRIRIGSEEEHCLREERAVVTEIQPRTELGERQ